MGNQASRTNKGEKSRRESISHQIVNRRIEQVHQMENQMMSHARLNPNISNEEMKRMLKATEYAKNQLDRGGKPLTKTDLVTIILALDISKIDELDNLQSLRLEDLNTMIRCLIYDPQRFVPKHEMIMESERPSPVSNQVISPRVEEPVHVHSNQRRMIENRSSVVNETQIVLKDTTKNSDDIFALVPAKQEKKVRSLTRSSATKAIMNGV